MSIARRLFLRALAAGSAAAVVAPTSLLADARAERRLSFLNTHTGERLTAPYFADGAYLPDGIRQLDRVLRDHRTGEQRAMDRSLYDLLHDLKLATGTDAPFQVISGFRSSKTNAALRAAGHGVASRSLHLDGKAIDVRVADVRLGVLRDAALELRRGGVGYYAGPDFVHLDTGRVRRW
jgi:uncharacterized protein YcbK (DUF882 family)